MTLEATDLVFRARALAQAHPLSPLANRFVKRVVAQERASQPLPEAAVWASGALVDGYCLRRIEEDVDGTRAELREWPIVGGLDPLDDLEEASSRVALALRKGPSDASSYLHDEERTITALDRLVASAVDRRLDHLRDEVDSEAWVELGEYLAWWVVKGYALRVVEC